jgi:subtilase family serine protease
VYEGSGPKTNNRGAGATTVTYREADLQFVNFSAPATASSGDIVRVEFTVINAGTRATRVDEWLDRVYLSQDASLDIYDALLGATEHKGVLAPGQSYLVSMDVRIPTESAVLSI